MTSFKMRIRNGAAVLAVLLAAQNTLIATAEETEGAAVAAEPDDVKTMNAITIYGEKNETTLQDAPIALSAITDEILAQAGITDASQLNGYVPGLMVSKSGGSERIVTIRGVGQQTPENFSTVPGVSFHVDGAFLPNSIALNMGFFDVNRIEVLRGPQGTVFGQSSTGGSINVITNQPELGEFGGDFKATLGDYNHTQGFASLNVPIGETFAVRASVQQMSHDGYAEATGIPGGYELDDADNEHYRLAALWSPVDDLSVTLSHTYYNDKHNGGALKNIDDPEPDIRVLTQDFPAKFKMHSGLTTLNVDYDLDFGTLKSVTSFQSLTHDQSFDGDRLDLETFGGYDHVATWSTEADTLMQELSLSSLPDSPVHWIGGVFFSQSESNQYVVEYRDTDATFIPGLPVLPRDTLASEIPANLAYENIAFVDREAFSPFFQVNVPLTERLSTTFGARYNVDKYEGRSASYYSEFSENEFDSNTWTGKVALDFKATEDNLIYTSWSRGYKPGGLNPGSNSALNVKSTYETEIVEAIEIGSKNTLLGGNASLNASLFYNKYDDMQFIEEDPIPYSGGIGNIPSAETWGLEIEGSVLLMDDRLQLGGNLALLDGEISEDYLALDRRLADEAGDAVVAAGLTYPWSYDWFLARQSAAVQVNGNTPPNLADVTYNLNASWFQPIGDHGTFTSRLERLYVGEYQARVFNTTGADDVPSYGMWNAYFKYEPNDQPWYSSVSLTNITDEEGVAGRFVDPYSSGTISNEYVAPRMLLVTFGYEF
ncbi:TonB-dependent receptor [Hirschia baltica]|uniref:TonB-dependent receptor n=1 Tax=Hirschia baltica (strain ATCC 49814 / DSM 5838 / IFAM 1418) TaxID=582402 RepID=C6XP38_HIRBI|nr:TonB-dependent receptor [Hirschia baltica]ACT60218.1 TonB-dependent receptor [Hirschia baltica ATCC 49814]